MSLIDILITFFGYVISFSYKKVMAKWHIYVFSFF